MRIVAVWVLTLTAAYLAAGRDERRGVRFPDRRSALWIVFLGFVAAHVAGRLHWLGL